jgi:copper chaperone CopZ|tara:strand:+ start:645 stop:1079 length:435 start_codon:yes stop_codon:yes gene_type:complete
MNKLLLTALLISSPLTWAHNHSAEMDMNQHSHEGHLHETMVDGKLLEVNAERFDAFMEGLTGVNVAIVSVQGMVCDFCARGIEKTFLKDKSVTKIDVDLDNGKVMIAYLKTKEIDFEEIKKKILSNGQTPVGLQILGDADFSHE